MSNTISFTNSHATDPLSQQQSTTEAVSANGVQQNTTTRAFHGTDDKALGFSQKMTVEARAITASNPLKTASGFAKVKLFFQQLLENIRKLFRKNTNDSTTQMLDGVHKCLTQNLESVEKSMAKLENGSIPNAEDLKQTCTDIDQIMDQTLIQLKSLKAKPTLTGEQQTQLFNCIDSATELKRVAKDLKDKLSIKHLANEPQPQILTPEASQPILPEDPLTEPIPLNEEQAPSEEILGEQDTNTPAMEENVLISNDDIPSKMSPDEEPSVEIPENNTHPAPDTLENTASTETLTIGATNTNDSEVIPEQTPSTEDVKSNLPAENVASQSINTPKMPQIDTAAYQQLLDRNQSLLEQINSNINFNLPPALESMRQSMQSQAGNILTTANRMAQGVWSPEEAKSALEQIQKQHESLLQQLEQPELFEVPVEEVETPPTGFFARLFNRNPQPASAASQSQNLQKDIKPLFDYYAQELKAELDQLSQLNRTDA